MLEPNGVANTEELNHENPTGMLVLFEKGQGEIVQLVADVLAKPFVLVDSVEVAAVRSDVAVVGLEKGFVDDFRAVTNSNRTVVNCCTMDGQDQREKNLSAFCDYEYIYPEKAAARDDVARFLSIVLGEVDVHEELRSKSRSYVLTVELPDVCKAIADIDIVSFGADAIELRVDLLEGPLREVNGIRVPGLDYIGKQVSELRRASKLPIIFAIRSSHAGGRFPLENSTLCYTYLCKAIQWGCEYIEVENRLPEHIKTKIVQRKGNSKIIASFYDYTGNFDWSSNDACRLFNESASFGDVVKMAAKVERIECNQELENFRAMVELQHPRQLFCGINIYTAGFSSLLFNKAFTPVSHPFLPTVSTYRGPNLADINFQLAALGHLVPVELFTISGNLVDGDLQGLLEKCANELGLSWHSPWVGQTSPDRDLEQRTINNITCRAIRSSLTCSMVPSAFFGRQAVIIGDGTELHAYDSALSALRGLKIGAVHAIGLKAHDLPVGNVKHIDSVEGLKDLDNPLVVISLLKRSLAAITLLKFLGSETRSSTGRSTLFIDLFNSRRSPNSPLAVAEHQGYCTYGADDVHVWRIAETLKSMFSQNISYGFVKSQV